VIVSIDNHPKPKILVSRRKLAAFVLDVLEKNSYIGEKVIVSQ
jgi:hypothetical protein